MIQGRFGLFFYCAIQNESIHQQLNEREVAVRTPSRAVLGWSVDLSHFPVVACLLRVRFCGSNRVSFLFHFLDIRRMIHVALGLIIN